MVADPDPSDRVIVKHAQYTVRESDARRIQRAIRSNSLEVQPRGVWLNAPQAIRFARATADVGG
jgi:hypothetical protein